MKRAFHYFFNVLFLLVFSTVVTACGDDGDDGLYGENEKEEKETVATPVIDVQGRLYTKSPEIEISCETEDAVIRYTLNNNEPNEASSEYTGPITLESKKTTVLKAKAFKDDYSDSGTTTERYTVTGVVSAPVFTLTPGSYTEKQTLKILSDTQEAVVKYTIDGSDPSRNNGTIYSVESMDIAKTTTLKAIAYVEDWQESSDSEITSETYEITGQVEPLSITPSGNYTSEIPVEITSNTPDIEIRYTLTDSDPSRNSGTLYKGPFTLKEDSKIKAMGYRSDWEESSDSEIVSAEYVITGHVEKPRFSVEPGIYTDTKTVSIACETSDSKISFTTDGSEPTRTNGYTYTEK
ncbi:MAG: chitobiase/beta-hexosaminidase C-terminal domain-containing protein, partial [bacterium]